MSLGKDEAVNLMQATIIVGDIVLIKNKDTMFYTVTLR